MEAVSDMLEAVEAAEISRCDDAGEEFGAVKSEMFTPSHGRFMVARCGKSVGAFRVMDEKPFSQAATQIEVEILRLQQQFPNLAVERQRTLLRGKHPYFVQNPDANASADAWLKLKIGDAALDALVGEDTAGTVPGAAPFAVPNEHVLDTAPHNSKVRVTADQGAIFARPDRAPVLLSENDVLQQFPDGTQLKKRNGEIHVELPCSAAVPFTTSGKTVAEVLPFMLDVLKQVN